MEAWTKATERSGVEEMRDRRRRGENRREKPPGHRDGRAILTEAHGNPPHMHRHAACLPGPGVPEPTVIGYNDPIEGTRQNANRQRTCRSRGPTLHHTHVHWPRPCVGNSNRPPVRAGASIRSYKPTSNRPVGPSHRLSHSQQHAAEHTNARANPAEPPTRAEPPPIPPSRAQIDDESKETHAGTQTQ